MIDVAGASWCKSSRSGGENNCVEVAVNLPAAVAVRDSKDPDGGVLVFPRTTWVAFVGDLKAGAFGPAAP